MVATARGKKAARPAPAEDGDDDAPDELPTRAAARPARESRRKAPSALELERAANEKQQEVIRAGLRDASAAPDALPPELLEQVAGVDMRAKPVDEREKDKREERMAVARRKRADERRRQAANLEALLKAERTRALSNPSRVLRTEGHFRLAQLMDETTSGPAVARAAPNPAALQFLHSHTYGSRLKRTSSAQAMAEALQAKRRRQLLAAQAPGGSAIAKRAGGSRKRSRTKRP